MPVALPRHPEDVVQSARAALGETEERLAVQHSHGPQATAVQAAMYAGWGIVIGHKMEEIYRREYRMLSTAPVVSWDVTDCHRVGLSSKPRGEMAEWSMAVVLKTTVPWKGTRGSNPSLSATSLRSIPETWVTDHSGDMGNTFGPNGFSIGSSRHVSSSK